MFSGCLSVRLSVRCPLTHISRDTISPYVVKCHEMKLVTNIFIMYVGTVGIAEKIFMARGQRLIV